MPDVFFYEAFAEEEPVLRQFMPAHISAGYTPLTIQEFGGSEPAARLISTRTISRVPFAWAPALDGILTRSTGYDHLSEFVASGSASPALGFLPFYCHRAVAEQAMLMWMALLRKLSQQEKAFLTFQRDHVTGAECQGKTLVVVGVGNIGSEICRVGQALGMRVLAVDIDPRFAEFEYLPVEAALPLADVVVCAMDFNRSNAGYFDADRIGNCKQGAMFVNISRGELSPSTVLLEGVRSGQLGGVGLDAFDHEPALAAALKHGAPSSDPEVLAARELMQLENVICTPHNAFNTAEAVLRKSEHSVQQIVAFHESGRFKWQV